jgi:uncharacterized protein YktB (UPF0637 family)
MEKEEIIKAIAERIKEEQKKHERNIPDWHEIAARKIYATFDINPKQDTVGKEFYESADKVITVKRQEDMTDKKYTYEDMRIAFFSGNVMRDIDEFNCFLTTI